MASFQYILTDWPDDIVSVMFEVNVIVFVVVFVVNITVLAAIPMPLTVCPTSSVEILPKVSVLPLLTVVVVI